ncbi:hypothetical protein C7999DRAFT_18577 [Corynascus novoguineensis]|uniref:Uncharacterized protein n=1 Tax=Corynascus novoguineensis TaxID=1126955 RepID=A0AAN7CL10_9PEZI|nr:hypothetical protein C7999DRAFT_18577 [Corynascus novoguineensis]
MGWPPDPVKYLNRQDPGAWWLGCATVATAYSTTGSTRIQYGLPCAHELVELMKAKKALTKADVSSFWWLKRDIKDPYTKLKPSPLGISKGRPTNEGGPFGQESIYKVPRPKGRTRTGIPDAGRRNYSQFE